MIEENMETIRKRISTVIIFVLFGLAPFLFVPLTQDPYTFPKWMFFLVTVALLIVLWGAEILLTRRVRLHFSSGFSSFGLLTVAAITSLIISSPTKVEALLSPLGPLTFGGLALFFLLTGPLTAKTQNILRWILVGIAIALSLIAIYQYLEIGKLILPTFEFLKDSAWTPLGSSVGLFAVLVILSPFVLFEFIGAVRERHDLSLAISAAGTVIVASALVLTTIKIIPNIPTTFLPYTNGWAIILETFKVPHQAIAGIGTENFLAAFTKGRPASANTTPLWNTRFELSSSALMHVSTVYGLVGLLGSLLIIKLLISRGDFLPLTIAKFLAMGVFIALPPNFTVLLVITALLFLSRRPESEQGFSALIPEQFHWLLTSVVLLLFGVLCLGGYIGSRVYAAEFYYQKALEAVAKKDGTQSYNLLIRTLEMNPYATKYHMTYSQVNLGVANGLAANLNGQTISDKDRATLSALMSQAIREGKLATALSPRSVLAWENLAKIYQAMIGAAAGADQWAIAAYQQAIQLDPTNPVLRFDLGGLYAQLGAYDSSQTQFQNAVGLKSDYINAMYNLAFVYKQQKSWLKAAVTFQKVLTMLPAGDPSSRERATVDYQDALSRLTDQERTALLGTGGTQVQEGTMQFSPPPTPIPTIHPQLELGTDASPSGTGN